MFPLGLQQSFHQDPYLTTWLHIFDDLDNVLDSSAMASGKLQMSTRNQVSHRPVTNRQALPWSTP